MSKWDGKSKGNPLGYKIFTFVIRKIGVQTAYFVLYFVAFYYLIFSVKGSKASYQFFKKQHKSTINAIYCVYKNNLVFGKTIIDKVAIKSGLKNKFIFKSHGSELITDLLKEKKGGILISAHVGNFELSEFFFTEVDNFSRINLLTTDLEHKAIKKQVERSNITSTTKFIIVKEDLSHIFEIHNALSQNELVVFTGDRYFEGSKILTANFLGEDANFPAGPFLLGSRLKVPVIFVYVMKESNKKYYLFAERASFKARDAKGLLMEYVKSIEKMLQKYPYQWFNFFDFWDKKQN